MRKVKDFLIWMVVALGCFLFTRATSAGSDRTSMIFNYTFMVIIILLYGIGLFGGFFRIYKLNAYFKFANLTIDQYPKKERNKNVFKKIDEIRRNPELDKMYDNFLMDLRSSKSGFVEIEDYINNDVVDDIIHKWLLDMIPELFTTLGILGTFLGLVWGLKSFDPSSIEAMSNSVTSLINGIKVAFLTSIYGMIGSLAFTYTMSKDYSELTGSVTEFIDKFHTYIISGAEMEARNRSYSMQSAQADVMARLPADLSESLAAGVSESITPKISGVQDSIDTINRTISEQIEMQQQDEGMDDDNTNARMVELLENIAETMSESARANEDSLSQLIQSNEDTREEIQNLIKSIKSLKGGKAEAAPSPANDVDDSDDILLSNSDEQEDDMFLGNSSGLY